MFYSYNDFTQDADSLVDQVLNSGKFYDYIVGVVRGGCIPAIYLSHRLEIPVRMVSWSTFHPEQMRESALDIAEDITTGKSILLIDDIIDSGRTTRELIEDWGCDRNQIGIGALIYNTDQDVKPNFFGRTINRQVDTAWITFWWEKNATA